MNVEQLSKSERTYVPVSGDNIKYQVKRAELREIYKHMMEFRV